MTWHVIWKPEAETELNRLMDAAQDPSDIVFAVETIETQLEVDPFSMGESRGPNDRIIFQDSYAMVVQIDHDDHFIFVRLFWRFAK